MEKAREKKKTRITKKEIGYNEKSTFPIQLNQLLNTHNMTQEALAKALGGITRQCVAQWLVGKTIPNIYYLAKISEYFNVSYEYLLDGVTSEKKDDIQISRETGLSSEAIEALRYYTDIFSELVSKNSPVEALNLLFTVYDETEVIDGVPEMNFFWHLRKYLFTTEEELERSLLSMNYLQADGGYEIITEEDLEENLLRKIEKRLRYYRKIAQEKLNVEKLKELEREERKQKRAVSSEELSEDSK